MPALFLLMPLPMLLFPALALSETNDALPRGDIVTMHIFIIALSIVAIFAILIHRMRKNAGIILGMEKADKDRLRDALAQIERERKAMENIQGALGSGQWSMEFDRHDNITVCVWTDTFRRMLGYVDEHDFPNELSSWADLLHEDDKQYVMKEYWDTVKDYSGRKTYDVQYRLLTKNAGWRWFHAAGRLSRREDGSPLSFVGFFIDIDDNKKLEARLEEQRLDLQVALAAAQRANRAKTNFLNNMSHDIRTPMNAIIGFTTLASAHVDNREQVLDYLKKISTSSKHLLSLINDVLDMSRIESGKVKIEENAVSLAEIIHDIKTIVQTDIASRRLNLHIDAVDIIDERILCDRLRLNQVLLNLLSNAIKFTHPGGSISIRLAQKRKVAKDCASYEFQVSDTGIGMSQEFLKLVFSPFERERTSTVSGIQGTGLGMAITKNIVDMMGGKISVASEKGKGTTFTVNLQFKSCPNGEKTVPGLAGSAALVVDDDRKTCSSIAHMLSDMGLTPDCAVSAHDAERLVRIAREKNLEYAVYVIDWLMPDMNGIDTVKLIREHIKDGSPIIILCAYDWKEMEVEARRTGVTAFCSKPVFFSELRGLLDAPAPQKQAAMPEEPAYSFHGVNILLVEDNAMNQEIVVEMLASTGFAIDTADNGAEALECLAKAEAGKYDLILMDIQMPVMNGYEATKKIRDMEDKHIANLPIIAMTADAFDEDKKAAVEAGMNAHVAKPIDFNKLLRLLEDILKSSKRI